MGARQAGGNHPGQIGSGRAGASKCYPQLSDDAPTIVIGTFDFHLAAGTAAERIIEGRPDRARCEPRPDRASKQACDCRTVQGVDQSNRIGEIALRVGAITRAVTQPFVPLEGGLGARHDPFEVAASVGAQAWRRQASPGAVAIGSDKIRRGRRNIRCRAAGARSRAGQTRRCRKRAARFDSRGCSGALRKKPDASLPRGCIALRRCSMGGDR